MNHHPSHWQAFARRHARALTLAAATLLLTACGGGGSGGTATGGGAGGGTVTPSPTQTGLVGITQVAQTGVTAITGAATAQWTALETLPAVDLQDAFVTKWQVTANPNLAVGKVFLLKNMAYKVESITQEGNNYIVNTAVPALEEVFDSLKIEGDLSLAPGAPSTIASQVALLAGGTQVSFDCDASINSDSKCSATVEETLGSTTVSVKALKESIIPSSPGVTGVDAWGMKVTYTNASLRNISAADFSRARRFSNASSASIAINADLTLSGNVGLYGKVTFLPGFDAASVTNAKKVKFNGYFKSDQTLGVKGDFQVSSKVQLLKLKHIIYVPVLGVPIPVTFLFPVDMLADVGVDADASVKTLMISQLTLDPSSATDKISFGDLQPPTVTLTGNAVGDASVQVRVGFGMGLAGVVPATMGVKGGVRADFRASASATTGNGPTCNGEFTLSPIAGADFILTPTAARMAGWGNSTNYDLFNKVFAPVYTKAGNCPQAPSPSLRLFYKPVTGTGYSEYAKGQRIPGTSEGALQMDARNSTFTAGQTHVSTVWKIYSGASNALRHTLTGQVVDVPVTPAANNGANATWEHNDRVEVTVTQTGSLSPTSKTTVFYINANQRPVPIGSFVYYPIEQKIYLNAEGSSDADGNIFTEHWKFFNGTTPVTVSQYLWGVAPATKPLTLAASSVGSAALTATLLLSDNENGKVFTTIVESASVSAIQTTPTAPTAGQAITIMLTGRVINNNGSNPITVQLINSTTPTASVTCSVSTSTFTTLQASCPAVTAAGSYRVGVLQNTRITEIAQGQGLVTVASATACTAPNTLLVNGVCTPPATPCPNGQTFNGSICVTTPTTKPDLIPSNVQMSSATVVAGNAVTVSWTMANTGTGAAAASTTGVRLVSASGGNGSAADDVINVTTTAIAAGATTNQSTSVTIPSTKTAGSYKIVIVADNVANSTLGQSNATNDYASSAAFNVTSPVNNTAPAVPVPSSPGSTSSPGSVYSGSLNSMPFAWSTSANATSYALKVYTVSGVEQAAFYPTTASSTQNLTGLNVFGNNFYWKVSACNVNNVCSNASASFYFTLPVPVIAPAQPTGLSTSPTSPSTSVTLTWASVSNASTYDWELVNTINGSGSASQSPTLTLSAGQSYTWRVRACNTAGCSQYATASFSTPAVVVAPPVPTPSAPVGSQNMNSPELVAGPNVSLGWNYVQAGLTYQINFVNETASSLMSNATVSDAYFNTSSLASNTTYSWQVRACSTICSNYSSKYYFKLQPVAVNPSILSVAPSSMIANNTNQNLIINGSNFLSGSVVQFYYSVGANANQWNNSGSAITSLSSSQIVIPMNPGATSDTIYVRVCSSSTLANCSNTNISVTVTAPIVSTPAIISITPTSMTRNTSGLLTINGSGFSSTDTVQRRWFANGGVPWGNTSSTPTFVSSNRWTVQINAGSVVDTIQFRVCNSAGQCSTSTPSVTVN